MPNSCYIIAEVGSNHTTMNGKTKLDKSKELIDMAADCGANCVKFQLFKADVLYSRNTPKFDYLQDERHIIDILEPCELPPVIIPELMTYCATRDVDFCCTPFDLAAVDLLEELGIGLFKVASFNIVDIPLLKRIGESDIPVVLSTGMATHDEIEEAIDAVGVTKIHHILHCNSQYPTPLDECNLAAIRQMEETHMLPTGYSDHTESVLTGAIAVGFGATCLEKHITISKNDQGSPDAAFALDRNEFAQYVDSVRAAEKMGGQPYKDGPSAAEEQLYLQARVSLHAAKDIKAGKILYMEDLIVKRPGTGLHPRMLEELIGRSLQKDIAADEPITQGHIGDIEC